MKDAIKIWRHEGKSQLNHNQLTYTLGEFYILPAACIKRKYFLDLVTCAKMDQKVKAVKLIEVEKFKELNADFALEMLN